MGVVPVRVGSIMAGKGAELDAATLAGAYRGSIHCGKKT
jgi:hypothetical protein